MKYRQPPRDDESPEPPPHRQSNIATLMLCVGTAYLVLGESLPILNPDVAMFSDAEGELDELILDPDFIRRVYSISVGRRYTLHTLFEHATSEQQAVIDKLPGSPVRFGNSQIRLAGGVGMKVTTATLEYQRLLRQEAIPQLLHAVGGASDEIEVNVFAGMSGGTGSWGALIKLTAVLNAMLRDCDGNIHVNVYLIGALTFNSPGFNRCRENSSLSLIDWLDFAENRFDGRVTVTLHLTELPPVLDDKFRRDQLAIDGVQAGRAPEMDRERTLHASNAIFDGRFGNVRLIRSGHYKSLSPTRIAADAANDYLPSVIRALATRQDLGRVKSLDWYPESEKLPHESVEGLIERLDDADADDLVASALQPASRVTAIPKILLKDKRTLDLSQADAAFASPLNNVKATCERLCLLKTCIEVMRVERDDLTMSVEELQARLEVAVQALRHAILDAQGLTWGSLLRSEETKLRRVESAARLVHAIVAELVEVEAKLHAAQIALGRLHELLRQLTTKLKRLRRLLRKCLPQGDRRRLPPAVATVPVDRFWKRLLQFAEDSHVDLRPLQHLLAQAVDHVLPEGLAAITGAADASLDAIARAAVSGKQMTLGPAWGGRESEQPGSMWLVYPPLDQNIARALTEHHHASSGSMHQIAFAKTALGSVNLVQLEIRHCQQLDEVWTRFYQQGYVRALTSDHPGFYDCNPEAAKRLGIERPSQDGKGCK